MMNAQIDHQKEQEELRRPARMRPVLAAILFAIGLGALALHSRIHVPIINPPTPTVNGVPLPGGSSASLAKDWVMGSLTAVSNAAYFGSPAKGWSIVCDGNGHFAPKSPNGTVCDALVENVRTNEWEAIVATWREQEVWDSLVVNPPAAVPNWHDCDK